MKTTISITIDADLYQKAKTYNLNISRECNQSITNKIAILESDHHKIDLFLLEKEMKKQEKLCERENIKLNNLTQKISIIKEKREKEETEKLEEELKTIEDSKRCKQCGVIIKEDDKFHNFPIGRICNGCYQGTSPFDTKKWMKDE